MLVISLYRGPVTKRGGPEASHHYIHILNASLAIRTPGSLHISVKKISGYAASGFHLFALLRRAALFCFAARSTCPPRDPQYSVMAPLRSRHMATRLGIEATMFPRDRARFAFSHRTAFRTRRRKDFSVSHPRGFVAASRPSSNDHAFSMGFRSGEYGGSPLQGKGRDEEEDTPMENPTHNSFSHYPQVLADMLAEYGPRSVVSPDSESSGLRPRTTRGA